MRSRAMPHSRACERTRRTACWPSAIASGMTVVRHFGGIIRVAVAGIFTLEGSRYGGPDPETLDRLAAR
jgi:hypothetical protein